ncbi:MAG: L,D-transpeptidase family protein [Polyangiaceae bacterium]
MTVRSSVVGVGMLLAGCAGSPETGLEPTASHKQDVAAANATTDRPLAAQLSSSSEPPSNNVAAASTADPTPEPTPAPAPEVEHPDLLKTCADARAIVVHKAARTLELRCGDFLVRRYEASLGFAPEGHKQHEGDGKTPEGDYFISKKFPSGFHRSLQIAYPNVADADAGLANGTISKAQHQAIVSAFTACREPPQTTPLGSLLQIHGGGGGVDVGDWTLGCVAVDDAEIEEVFSFQQLGCDKSGVPLTLVRILP